MRKYIIRTRDVEGKTLSHEIMATNYADAVRCAMQICRDMKLISVKLIRR